MPEKYTYLLVDILSLIFPFVFSFYPKINFYKQWKYFFPSCLLTALFFVTWDIIFTKKGIWGFNPRYVCSIYYFGLPLEEYLFFICIPYACIFTFYCMNLFIKFKEHAKATRAFSLSLIVFLIVIAIFNPMHFYTSITFFLLACLLVFLLAKKATFLFPFYISFLVILFPFFISNGILTGSFIAAPVVIYNNNYNLGLRMFTIPVEDVFYGMLLLIMNVAGFQYFKNKKE